MNNLRSRIRQFGLYSASVQIVRAMLRLVYRVELNIVFVIPEFSTPAFNDPCIVPMTRERIQKAANAGGLKENEIQLLAGFLAEGCHGICAEINGKLAGYAWIQFEGEYRFGRTGQMIIPPNYAMVKNLLVFPEYRGCKLGQKLNVARLAQIPSGHIPVAFIIPENRFSIRNWEKYGFQRVLQVKRWSWFRGPWRMHIERLANVPEVVELEKALKEGNK